ncbi:cell division ATP-binding protein FtsE [Demetria terragena]|uniref:cell division ATP-binding protein FtsE n=1 Tax=Demetria terragena TaxID=63959 RepID=UPI00035FC64F|nr:cell division ATP-binding protein FtsE [Demetria terragena]
MIRFDQVTMRYDKEPDAALDDLSLEIERGDFVFVVGASGSGKSTLLKLMTRELIATDGELLVAGRDLRRLPDRKVPQLRREIGAVFQDFRLLEDKTVSQNVAFALQVLGRKRHQIKQLVPEALEVVGLNGKGARTPRQLSGGEQQRVAIARAIVNKPTILLADEPTGNLDPDTSTEIVEVLERVNKAGTTVVMATHDHHIVDDFRKRVIELAGGVVVRDDLMSGYVAEPKRGIRR